MNTKSNVSIDDLLDGTLDDLADVPSFKCYPAGAHLVKIAFDVEKDKEGKKTGVMFFRMEYREPLELANSEDVPPAMGDKDAVRWDLTNEFGQGNFKVVISALKQQFFPGEAKSNAEVMEAADGLEVGIVTKVRKGKKGTDKEDNTYTDIVGLVFG